MLYAPHVEGQRPVNVECAVAEEHAALVSERLVRVPPAVCAVAARAHAAEGNRWVDLVHEGVVHHRVARLYCVEKDFGAPIRAREDIQRQRLRVHLWLVRWLVHVPSTST